MRNAKLLLLRQMDTKIAPFRQVSVPVAINVGWIKAIRTSLNITLEQLGSKLGISKQSVLQYEKSESLGSISIKNLSDIGEAMDLQFVYGFIPKDGSLEKLVERKAMEMAKKIVMRTHQNMKLESQENSDKHIEAAILELRNELKTELHKSLWD